MGAESGAAPWGSILQAGLGIGQALFSGRKKAERNLENFSDSYKPNSSILDYFNKAMANYSANPYNSQSYQNQTNQVNRNLATGISASQDRRAGIGSLGALVGGANQADANAASAAEARQNQSLGILGNATRMKAAEDYKPFEMKLNLLASKASGANATQSAGIANIGNAFNSISNFSTAKKLYGGGGGNNILDHGGWGG